MVIGVVLALPIKGTIHGFSLLLDSISLLTRVPGVRTPCYTPHGGTSNTVRICRSFQTLWHKFMRLTPLRCLSSTRSGINTLLISVVLALGAACSYRFSNLHIRLPAGIRSIAIESVYDTSRQVLPHQMLWSHLQRAVVAEGHLQLTDQRDADVYLRAHIDDQAKFSYSDINDPPIRTEPKKLTDDEGKVIPPTSFDNLRRADRYASNEHFTVVIHVEVWNLHTRKRIFSNSYSIGATYQPGNSLSPTEAKFIRANEIFNYHFDQQSEQISQTIIRDIVSAISL